MRGLIHAEYTNNVFCAVCSFYLWQRPRTPVDHKRSLSSFKKMRFTVKRIKRQNPHSHVVRIKDITNYSKAKTDGGGAGRSVG